MLTRERVALWLERRFLLRLHMTFILGGTFLAGLAATKVMFLTGIVENLALRYGVAVCVAYVMFLGLIRLWLRYVSVKEDNDGYDFVGDGIDLGSEVLDNVPAPTFRSGGGSFGGGGASGSWGSVPSPAAHVSSASTNRGCFPSIDLDFDGLVVIVLFLALVAALLFAGVYIIYTAPAILTEAAFEAALAGVLAKRARKIDRPGWTGAVTRATAWPFLAILILSVALGWAAQRACPEALTMREAFHCAPR
jgi:hypothetical protein